MRPVDGPEVDWSSNSIPGYFKVAAFIWKRHKASGCGAMSPAYIDLGHGREAGLLGTRRHEIDRIVSHAEFLPQSTSFCASTHHNFRKAASRAIATVDTRSGITQSCQWKAISGCIVDIAAMRTDNLSVLNCASWFGLMF